MIISAKLVQELREKTNVGMMDCKKALEEAGGNLAEAEVVLRKKGVATAAKKAPTRADRPARSESGAVEVPALLAGRIPVTDVVPDTSPGPGPGIRPRTLPRLMYTVYRTL